jgi:oligopeptide transport system substrate-binding protein
MRRLARVVAAAWFAAGLAACERQSERADLVFINGAEPESLDPAIITGQPEGRIVHALFEGLLAFDADGKAGPGVAESWNVSEDGRVYTFRLRENARWSDGAPVTARDFVASWRRTLLPETGSIYNYMLHYIKNAKLFSDGKLADFNEVGVRALDDRTLEVTLENPTPFFLELCAFPTLYPVPVALIERVGDSWIKPEHLVNNGAFLLESWRINDKIRLRRNPWYWNKEHVALETVEILPIAKESVAFNFYSSGIADLMMDKGLTPVSILDELKKRKDFHAAPFFGSYFLRFNCAEGAFTDVRVRLAFSMAVDKPRITQKITRAGELPASSLVPPGIEGYASPEGLPYDPQRARELLAEAGYPEGRGFPLTTYLYSEGDLNQSIAIELQAMWLSELGVKVNLARQEWKVYLNSLNSLDYGMARSTWVGDYPDPNTFLDMFVTEGGNNRTGWSDPAYDQLIAEAAKEADPAKRFEIFRRAEKMLIAEQAPICPLYYYVGIQLYDPEKLGGISANVLDEHPIRNIHRKDREATRTLER